MLILGLIYATDTLASGKMAMSVNVERLGPSELALVVNDLDPLSVKIANYYRIKRKIPMENVVHVRISPQGDAMTATEFQRVKSEVDKRTPTTVQAYALAWTKPYKVDCMSITTAFAAGWNRDFCATGCALTKPISYFNSASAHPYNDYKLRPSMLLAGQGFEDVKRLIDRGLAADNQNPSASAYLLSTSDGARNVRAASFPLARRAAFSRSGLQVLEINADFLENRDDVMFYFTGTADVRKLKTNRFLPGAIADHLTSSGGDLDGQAQMSSLRWLEAGATGSYGTVVEPCNFPQKFPDPALVIRYYTRGATLVEAYWKSVAMPGQGVFIGEPLSHPYGSD